MRTAILLFNLGGPDRPEAVEPFLRNLFSDPAILRVPGFIRPWLARTIARRRAPIARQVYDKLGGGSPLLPNTQAQARALEVELTKNAPELGEIRCFIAMRYWHPRAEEAAAAVKEFAPDRILLLPLYPQFSTTTTASSLADWRRAANAVGLDRPTQTLCCYATEPGFVAACADLARPALARARLKGRVRLLFSAHGLPVKIVKAGDPYPAHIEATARAIAQELGIAPLAEAGADAPEAYEICYQSRVGPVEWLGPYTDAVIEREARAGAAILLLPLAFVSEHSETLVELDIEYRELAAHHGAAAYERVATVGTNPAFIEGLAGLAAKRLQAGAAEIGNEIGRRRCAASCACAMR